jgi:hypothetical protein
MLLSLVHCAGGQRVAESGPSAAPGVTVRLYASGPQTPNPRELGRGDLVRGNEQVEMDVSAQLRPAHVYVALYEPAGSSTLLFGGATHRQVLPGEPVRITVPRRVMPGGGPATEVRLFVMASEKPLEQAMCPLLRVRCPLDQPAPPVDESSKKQCDVIPDPPSSPGVHSPATLQPVVIKYE